MDRTPLGAANDIALSLKFSRSYPPLALVSTSSYTFAFLKKEPEYGNNIFLEMELLGQIGVQF